ncbi:hypothetical protein [Lentzea sp. NPDC092896]|uniref:hypothetical protein n=1 Tax=Lentzea sp. NPDC092896 TaxID=3364127 RepID=UPI0038003860
MGTLRSTHLVGTDRRRVLGRVLLVLSLACAAMVALSFVIDLDGAENGLVFALIPLGLNAPAAFLLLRKARRPEVIELHDDGIAHVIGGVTRSWRWDQVSTIDATEQLEPDCTLRFSDGAMLHISGTTQNSRLIVSTLTTHCLDATRAPLRSRHKRYTAVVLGAVTLVTGAVAVLTGPTVFTVACGVMAVLSLILLISVLVTGRR